MTIEVKPLKCPVCSTALSGFERDALFFCPNCPVGWDFSDPAGKPLPLSYARAKMAPDKYRMVFYLPFYRFEVELHLSSEEALQARVDKLARELDRIYVSGFRLMRESYFGDLALLYTEAKTEFEEDASLGRDARKKIGAAGRSLKEAEPYLKHYPLLIIDKRQDITGMTLEAGHRLERIWAVPFYDLGKQIQDGILGRTFSSYALDAIDEFRKAYY